MASPGVGDGPFLVVGCPRSGTTLLRAMLDAHPRLAVPRESHFIVGLAPRRGRPSPTVEDVIAHRRFPLLDVDPGALRAAVAERPPRDYAELVSAVFSTYAAAQGKARWGDKTPGYAQHIPMLADLFPTSQFIHIMRDGREVAASLVEQQWGPRTAIDGAYWWRSKVRSGRRDGRCLPASRYLEVRLEDLVADPEGHLRRLCIFLDEEYSPEMLRYPERMGRPGARESEVGGQHLTKPPTADLRDWRAGRGELEQEAVESVCSALLAELGYPARAPTRRGLAYARYVRTRDLALRAPHDVRLRMRPRERAF